MFAPSARVIHTVNPAKSQKNLHFFTHLEDNPVESILIICITLLSDIQERYEKLINQALDVCFELSEAENQIDGVDAHHRTVSEQLAENAKCHAIRRIVECGHDNRANGHEDHYFHRTC